MSTSSLRFFTLREGLISPIEFRKLKDGSRIPIVERDILDEAE